MAKLPTPLRWYLLLVIVSGPLLAVVTTVSHPISMSSGDAGRLALLFLMTIAAERFTVHLTHKTAINVSAACYLAAILVFPLAVPGLLALTAGLIGQVLRPRRDPLEAAFNAAQGSMYVTLAAIAFASASTLPVHGPSLGVVGTIVPVLVAAAVLYVVNTGLIAVAAGLQLGTNPYRVWIVNVRQDLGSQAALSGLGVLLGDLLLAKPLLVPLLLLPLILVHVAMRDRSRLRAETFAALTNLVAVVELRDPYTAGHSHRVAPLARRLALELGLTNEEADVIEGAGRVHDLGKVAIDSSLLTKPGHLTDEEYAEVKRHPSVGADVIALFSACRTSIPLIRHHHERWDGAGYPDGLAGGAIPLGARILAVADTFDALTSDRPYRSPLPVDRALAVLAAGAGSQWDPRVVAALLAVIRAPAQSVQPEQPAELVLLAS